MTITLLIILIYLTIGYYSTNKEFDELEEMLNNENEYSDFIEDYNYIKGSFGFKSDDNFNVFLFIVLTLSWLPFAIYRRL